MVGIGIDLGTTYSCVGVWKNDHVEIIANSQGMRTTPSYISYSDEGEVLKGDSAKNNASMNPLNTIFDVKRFIGRKFSDPVLQKDLKYFPFKVEPDDQDRPRIVVTKNDKEEKYYPEQFSAMLLTYLKECAEAYVGHEVKDAVITVPAYFNDTQRQATKDAGIIAGLNVLRIINEPTAAAIAYGLDKDDGNERNILIFDLGGGTFDVSVLTVDSGAFTVRSTSGDTHLGGEDFDNRLVDYCVKDFKAKKKVDLSQNPRALRRLRTACERAKRLLSGQTNANIQVEAIHDGVDLNIPITRAKFEELCGDLFRNCIQPVERALTDAKMSKGDIHDVVLVGGSTRIPKIKELLSNFFNGKKLCESINPDEAVAYGAAVQAAKLSGDKSEKITDIILYDVQALSLGIEVQGTTTEFLIKRGTQLPARGTNVFTTGSDYQTVCRIKVLEGERLRSSENNVLGQFDLTDITPMKRGDAQIEVIYDVDMNGILTVTATEKLKSGNGKTKSITVNNNKGKFTKEQIDEMISQAEKFKDEDLAFVKRVEARNNLDGFVTSWSRSLDNTEVTSKMNPDDVEKLKQTVKDATQWLDENMTANTEDYQAKLEELRTTFAPYQNNVSDSMPNGMPNFSPEQLEEMMKNMSPEQLEQLKEQMKAQGLPDMTPEQMAEAMKSMSSGPTVEEPDELD